jgi:uncharacterized protein
MPTDVGLVDIIISGGSMKARGRLNPDADFSGWSEEALLESLSAHAIEITDEARDRVRLLVERVASGDFPAEDILLVEGQPPEPGVDGRVEWAPDRNPMESFYRRNDSDGDADEADAVIDHYSRTSIISVSENDLLCTIIPPVEGAPGRDIYGKDVPPPKPRKASLRAGQRVALDEATGKMTATTSGRVQQVGNRLYINPLLTIAGDVDFEVGNIDFDGDVLIRGNVLDRFSIKCTRGLAVRGMIEAARIECGGDLIVSGGIAGKQKAVITSGGKVVAHFIDNATVTAADDVMVKREMVNSTVVCQRNVITPGAITACRIEASGGVEATVIGSSSGVRTELTVGGSREAFRRLGRADRDIAALEERIRQQRIQLEPLLKRKAELAQFQKSMMAKLLKEIKAGMEQLEKLKAAKDELQQSIDSTSSASVQVARMIHEGTTVQIGEAVVTLRDTLRGPLRLIPHTIDGQQRIVASGSEGGIVVLESYP